MSPVPSLGRFTFGDSGVGGIFVVSFTGFLQVVATECVAGVCFRGVCCVISFLVCRWVSLRRAVHRI